MSEPFIHAIYQVKLIGQGLYNDPAERDR